MGISMDMGIRVVVVHTEMRKKLDKLGNMGGKSQKCWESSQDCSVKTDILKAVDVLSLMGISRNSIRMERG
jgi:hypothetical protein